MLDHVEWRGFFDGFYRKVRKFKESYDKKSIVNRIETGAEE